MWKKFTPNLGANQDEIVCTGAAKRPNTPGIRVSAAQRLPQRMVGRANIPSNDLPSGIFILCGQV